MQKIIKVIIAIMIVCAAIPILLMSFFALHTFGSPNPLEPKVKYAEFPFELVYEINGETKIVKDVYICEYDGVSAYVGVEKERQWVGYVKNSADDEFDIVLAQDGEIYVICRLGLPGYYMDDPDYEDYNDTIEISYIIKPDNPGFFSTMTVASPEEVEQLLEKYQLKIISWEIADPIENEYKMKETGPAMYVFIGCMIALEILFIVIVIVRFIKKGKTSQKQ